MRDLGWYLRAWAGKTGLEPLRLTDDERNGIYGRVEPRGLIQFPAIMPILGGLEPYGELRDAVRGSVLHDDAILEFAYDWRLPVAHNARIFAKEAGEHLRHWRRHEAHSASQRTQTDEEIKLVVVAHSMGGLVVQEACALSAPESGLARDIRWTMALGAPFSGALKVALLLAYGKLGRLPLPRARAQKLAATLPGVYDLLPVYRCVDEGGTARRLGERDAGTLRCSEVEMDRALAARLRARQAPLPNLVQVIGTGQQTLQSLTIAHGRITGHRHTCKPAAVGDGIERMDLSGDGTVSTEAAGIPGTQTVPVFQSHGGLSSAPEVTTIVAHFLKHGVTGEKIGPWLGEPGPGVAVPDSVAVGEPFDIAIEGVERAGAARCQVTSLVEGRPVRMSPVVESGGSFVVRAELDEPGFYRVEVAAGSSSFVTQHLLATGGEPHERPG